MRFKSRWLLLWILRQQFGKAPKPSILSSVNFAAMIKIIKNQWFQRWVSGKEVSVSGKKKNGNLSLPCNASWISHIAVNGFANTGNTYVNSRTTSSSGPSGNPFKFFLKYFSRTDLSKVCSEADIVNCFLDFLTVVCMAIMWNVQIIFTPGAKQTLRCHWFHCTKALFCNRGWEGELFCPRYFDSLPNRSYPKMAAAN